MLVMGSVLGVLQHTVLDSKSKFWEVPALSGGGGLPFSVLFFFAGLV